MQRGKARRSVGLARALSKLGYCSRAQAFALIRAGRVSLNGSLRHNPETPVHLEQDHIEVDHRLVCAAPRAYFALNKPRGAVTTASDEKGRKTVYECLAGTTTWIAPVGRLDKASEGLLLFTNDSEWAARLLAPETGLEKTYHVHIRGVAGAALLESMVMGVKMSDGDFLKVKDARVLRQGGRNTWLEVILDEGKNRHIRCLLAELGISVLRLVRVAIGPLKLGKLPKGGFRRLTTAEKEALDGAMQRRTGPTTRNRVWLPLTTSTHVSK